MAVVAHLQRARPDRRPDRGVGALLADAGRVLEADFDRRARGGVQQGGANQAGKFFKTCRADDGPEPAPEPASGASARHPDTCRPGPAVLRWYRRGVSPSLSRPPDACMMRTRRIRTSNRKSAALGVTKPSGELASARVGISCAPERNRRHCGASGRACGFVAAVARGGRAVVPGRGAAPRGAAGADGHRDCEVPVRADVGALRLRGAGRRLIPSSCATWQRVAGWPTAMCCCCSGRRV